MRQLFGTVTNIFERLSLSEEDIPVSEFKRALSFGSIKPEHAELIEDSWEAWRTNFLLRPDEINFNLKDQHP